MKMPHAHSANTAEGYTIVELLVAMAIIMIMVSLLLTGMSHGQTLAKETVCKSNLKNIGQASASYLIDKDVSPACWDGSNNSVVWIMQLWSYIPHPEIFYCPIAPAAAKWAGPEFGSGLPGNPGQGYLPDQNLINVHRFFSYGINNGGTDDSLNLGLTETWDDYVNGRHVRRSMIKTPQNFIAYGDTTADGFHDFSIDEDIGPATGPNEYPADRHGDASAHIAFGDGHVELIPQRKLWHFGTEGTALPEVRKKWNHDNQPH